METASKFFHIEMLIITPDIKFWETWGILTRKHLLVDIFSLADYQNHSFCKFTRVNFECGVLALTIG